MQTNNSQPVYLLHKLRDVRLEDATKARMRAALSAYADFHTSGAFAKPVGSRVFPLFVRAFGAALIVVLLAGGTSYASEKALPGQPLYMVKVRFAEPIELVLAPSPAKKARVHATHAERRLEEAAKLAVANKLDTGTKTFLEQKFSEHVDGSLKATTDLEASGEVDEALDARTELEARLVAHSEILDLVEDRLQKEGEGAKVAHESTEDLIKAVEPRAEVVEETRVALERKIAGTATPATALALVTKATERIPSQARAAEVRTIAAQAAEAAEELAEAKEAIEQDSPERAFSKAVEATRESEVVSTMLKHSDIIVAVEEPATTTATTTPQTATTAPQ